MEKAITFIAKHYSKALLWVTAACAVFYVAKARFDPNMANRAILALLTGFFTLTLSMGKAILDQLRRNEQLIQKPAAVPHLSPEELYDATSKALTELHEHRGPKVLRHAILHGHVGQPRITPAKRQKFYARFDSEIERCIRNSSSNSWEIRQLYLVVSEARLDMILERLQATESQAENHTVRVFVPSPALPYLSFVIAGDRSANIAVDDPSLYRVKWGLEISGKSAVTVISEYFDSLWAHSENIEIRSVNRFNPEGISKVREQLRSLTCRTDATHG